MNEAIRYGTDTEKYALDLFFRLFKQQHQNPILYTTGLTLYKELPFLEGSSDGVMICGCCRNAFLVEVKCSFRLKDTGIKNWSILEYFDANRILKRTHSYLNQINLYQGIL